jgi:hypothetical protein
MRRFFGMTMLVMSALPLGGCALEATLEEDSASAGDELTFGESPSTVTFYENPAFSGAQLAVQIQPSGTLNETVDLVTRTEIEQAKISAVRLQCGDRKTRVVLFSAQNTATTFGSWSAGGSARPVDCAPGQTVNLNLHTADPTLADKVGSAYFVRHANKSVEQAFSSLVVNGWNAAMEELPSGASAKGDPKLKMTSGARFTLRQDLTLDDALCGDRPGLLNLAAQLYQDRHFVVTVINTYVDTGWGDAWGCRDKMKKKLDEAAAAGAEDFEDGLEQLLALQLPVSYPRYYFEPSWSVREFDIVGGGKPSSTGVVIP